MPDALSISSESPEATLRVGRALGERLGPGDVVALVGALGSGKTVLVKGLAEGLGAARADEVVSRTYVLLGEYTGLVPLYHFDLYRLSDARDLGAVSLEETCAGPGVTVIEWAERAAGRLPADRLDVRIDHVRGDERALSVTPRGTRWQGAAWEDLAARLRALRE